MIKAILFDNGGVVVNDDWLPYITQLKLAHPFIAKEVLHYEAQATRGEISLPTFQALLSDLTKGLTPTFDPERPNDLIPGVITYINTLKNDYIVGLLTNEFSTYDIYNHKWHLEKVFGEKVFRSSKIGISKPNMGIYEYALSQLGLQPEEVLFVDDRSVNIESARKLGMNVIQFKTLEQLKSEVSRMLEDKNVKK
jgi:HAD superfamily hydrolase (TIGR01509 family)